MPHSWNDPHPFAVGESIGLAAWLAQLGGDAWYVRERVDWPYTNTSGSDVVAGQLMVQDTGADAALTLPAGSVGEAGPFWVTLVPIADGSSGFAARTGVVALAYLGTDPVPGDRLHAAGTAGFTQVGTTEAFATALYDGASGYVYALLDGPGGSGGGSGGGSDATREPFTPPVLTGLTTVNITGGHTATQVGDSIVLNGASNPGSNVISGLLEAVPVGGTGHWQFTAAFRASMIEGTTVGILLKETSTGHFGRGAISLESTGLGRRIDWNSAYNAWGGGLASLTAWAQTDLIWARWSWDGTNIRFWRSQSGRATSWVLDGVYAIGGFSMTAPDWAGVFVSSNSASGATIAEIWHWLVESIA